MALNRSRRGARGAFPEAFAELVVPFGPGSLSVYARALRIVRVSFGPPRPAVLPPHELLHRAKEQIEQYLAGRRKKLSLPFSFPPASTAFQLRTWQEVLAVPYGQTRTYGEIAAKLGTSPRAVGGALRANALPLLIPCHRVLAKNALGGFAGSTHLTFKRFLLTLEGVKLPQEA